MKNYFNFLKVWAIAFAMRKSGKGINDVTILPALIMGVGVAILILVFVGVLGGQVYQQVEPQLAAIQNVTVRGNVTGAIQSGFQALNTTASYMPIIVLAIIIFIVLGLVTQLPGSNRMSGSAL